MERHTEGTKIRSGHALTAAGPTVSQGSLLPEVVDEILNELNLHYIPVTAC